MKQFSFRRDRYRPDPTYERTHDLSPIKESADGRNFLRRSHQTATNAADSYSLLLPPTDVNVLLPKGYRKNGNRDKIEAESDARYNYFVHGAAVAGGVGERALCGLFCDSPSLLQPLRETGQMRGVLGKPEPTPDGPFRSRSFAGTKRRRVELAAGR